MSLLAKGLTFSPTNDFNVFGTILDVNKFARTLTLRNHFFNKVKLNDNVSSLCTSNTVEPSQVTNQVSGFSFAELCSISSLRVLSSESRQEGDPAKVSSFTPKNSNFYPYHSRPATLDLFQELVEHDLVALDKSFKSQHTPNNITQKEKIALKQLSDNKDLIVRKADKGGAVIIMNGGLYKILNKNMLDDETVYRKLNSNPTGVFQNKLRTLLNDGVYLGVFDQGFADKLFVMCPVVPILHSLPKYHKNIFPPPMRPIVSGMGSMGESLGVWIDHHLQPLISVIPGFIRDTKFLVSTLNDFNWTSDSSWLSCDVVGLYPSIPHDKGIIMLSKFLDQYSSYTLETKDFLVRAVDFLLGHNYFSFDGDFYLQQQGASMGARFSPSLANIFMAMWEESFLFSETNPFAPHIRWYGRFIDDLLLVWGGKDHLVPLFVDYLNSNDFNLKFTYHHHRTTISFLDVLLTGDDNLGVVVSPYRKDTATNSVLMATSCHPLHVTKNLPIGELIRVKRNSSTPEIYDKAKKDTCQRLRYRKYPAWSVNRACNIVENIDRQNLLKEKNKSTGSADVIPPVTFTTTFSPVYKQVTGIIKKYLPILNNNSNLQEILKNGVRFVSKKAPTLGDKISPSLFLTPNTNPTTWLDVKGFFKCGHTKCTACNYAKITKDFVSCNNGKKSSIVSYINCNTKNVVYLISCTQCSLQYVGCTSTPLKTRIRRHLSDIRNTSAVNISGASRHFKLAHDGDLTGFTFSGIERVFPNPRGGDLKKKILHREAKWIFDLNTRSPAGLNLRSDILYQLH